MSALFSPVDRRIPTPRRNKAKRSLPLHSNPAHSPQSAFMSALFSPVDRSISTPRRSKANLLSLAFLLSTAVAACSQEDGAAPEASSQSSVRPHISIVGSSTVYPFSALVAERFGVGSGFPTPRVESTGSGSGISLFCKGVGERTPDITNASRRMKSSEFKQCNENGVTDIVEVPVGYDGIALLLKGSETSLDFSLRDIFLALARKVPDPSGAERAVDNPYRTWKQVNAIYPDRRIEVYGPPPSSGTRDAFVELGMEEGCRTFPWLEKMRKSDKNRFKELCHSLREDGHFIEAGENDNLLLQKVQANPGALGIVGYSYLEANIGAVAGAAINHIKPEYDLISSGAYPLSRTLFFYVKKAHIGLIPGIEEFIAEFTSERSWSDDGYMAEKGLIALPQEQRRQIQMRDRDLAMKPL